MNYRFGPSFYDFLRRLVRVRLGEEYTFVEVYGAFEGEGVLVTVKDAQGNQCVYALIDGELELVDRL